MNKDERLHYATVFFQEEKLRQKIAQAFQERRVKALDWEWDFCTTKAKIDHIYTGTSKRSFVRKLLNALVTPLAKWEDIVNSMIFSDILSPEFLSGSKDEGPVLPKWLFRSESWSSRMKDRLALANERRLNILKDALDWLVEELQLIIDRAQRQP
jgi:hypothetical protein